MGNWTSTGRPITTSKLQQPLTMAQNTPPPPTTTIMARRGFNWWLSVAFNTTLLLAGQVAATLLNRFYYNEGGNSKWLQTLTVSAAFPILYIPLLFLTPSFSSSFAAHRPSISTLFVTYTALGLIAVADSLMYAYGLLYLQVSTYSLVCATQLAFNAVFSYFINSKKFTHLTLNSVVVLTFSAAIIATHSDSASSSTRSANVFLGFALTLAASATYSLILSLMELAFDKVIKSSNFSAVLNMQIYTAMVSTIAAAIGLFWSGEWKGLKEEMEGFKKGGRVGWSMTVVWSAVAWQVTNVGLVGLIFEVSSLFSNVMSTLGIPIVPVFAVILFGDRMDGMKVISLLLALWGFVSYFYQHFLDCKSDQKVERKESMEVCGV